VQTFMVRFQETRKVHLSAPIIHVQAEAALQLFEFFLADARNRLSVFYGAWQQFFAFLDADVEAKGQIFDQTQRRSIVNIIERSIQALSTVGPNAAAFAHGLRSRLAPFKAYLA